MVKRQFPRPHDLAPLLRLKPPGGQAGVERAIEILGEQIIRTMKLLGVASLPELEPAHVTQLQRLVPLTVSPPT